MKLILVDSYDSFTHNLAQAFRVLGAQVSVVASDRATSASLLSTCPDLVVLGPGPGRPEVAGCLVSAAGALGHRIPILGVCLGHQAIALAFGGRVIQHSVVHGQATSIVHHQSGIFRDIPQGAPMTRYHSLVVDGAHLPACLQVTARSEDGAIQGLRHRTLPIYGIQFHPESVLTGAPGLQVLRNFVSCATVSSRTTTPKTPALDPQRCGSSAMESALR
ncbi:MAG: anthranilate/aminodeoxychorismate synthase component II [Rhodobacterales bacterium]|nr:anthranilate/aminodeoxychorismate synthase component II [Rhodobacterales bacterium]